MSDFQQKDMTGTIFRNDKRSNERAPNARGSCVIDGVAYKISAWTKTTKKGDAFQSLSFERESDAPTKHDDPTERKAGDEEIPW